MAQPDTSLSGTTGCPNCRLGKFQPGLLIIDSTCLCTGRYVIKGDINCSRIDNMLVCTKIFTVIPGNIATCHCNGKTYKATTFSNKPLPCTCNTNNCKTAKVTKLKKTKIP